MPSFNKVILMGNLTRDPELRVTPNGNSICKIGIATSRVYKTQDGQQREETTFVDVDIFGRQAEIISKYFQKGKPILIEGRLKLDQWQDKQSGQNRSKLGVVMESFEFVGGRGEGGSGGPSNDYDSNAPQQRNAPQSGMSEPDDDVPF